MANSMRKLTQREIARILKISEQSLSMLINGSRNIGSWKEAERIATVTGTEPQLWVRDGGSIEERKRAIDQMRGV